MKGSKANTDSHTSLAGEYRRRIVHPLTLLAVAWAAACGGDGGTDPEPPPPQPNRAPVASGSIPAQTMTVGESVTVNAASLFTDPDGDALTYSAISSAPGTAGVALSGTNVTVTAAGAGTATITVTARDPGGLSAAASGNVTVVEPNRAPAAILPVAPPQTASLGDTLSVDVSPFFSDPDGDALTYSATSSNTSVATVSVTGSVVSGAAVGVGSTTLTVTATDPEGLSASLSVPVTVLQPNRPPVAIVAVLPPQTVEVGDTLPPTDVSAFFDDPDGDDLTYSASSSDAGVVVVTLTGSTVSGVAVAQGTATLTATATDPDGLSASLTVAVTVNRGANQPPVAVVGALPPQTVQVGQTVMFDGNALFSDPNDDALTFTAETSDAAVVTVSAVGSIVTGTAVAAGTATVTLTASDPEDLTASLSVSVTVTPQVNQAPEATGEIRPINQQVGWTGRLELEDDSPLFVDPDGDELTYSAESSDPSVAGVSVTGTVLTVTAEAVGTALGTVTATDPGGLSASVDFDITVISAAGTIFRDDFDGAGSLSNWELDDAEAEVSEGILRLTNTTDSQVGEASRELGSPYTSWEASFRLGRAQVDSTVASVIFITGDPRFQAFRMDIGSGITVTSEGTANDTNYRFFIYDNEEERFLLPAGWFGSSAVIHDDAGEFTEVSVSIIDRRLLVSVGTTELIDFSFSSIVPAELEAVALWVISLESPIPRTGLFDWIEVSGVPTDGSSANADGEGIYRSLPVDITKEIDASVPISATDVFPGAGEKQLQVCVTRNCR